MSAVDCIGTPAPLAQQETWRDVPDFPGYQVSDLGRVRSRLSRGRCRERFVSSWRILSPGRLPKGYLSVHLQRDGLTHHRYVHRLVLEAFVGPCPPECEARHVLSPDPRDNRLVNLAWGTPKENAGDTLAHGNRPMGTTSGSAKLTDEEVSRLLEEAVAGVAVKDLARKYGIRKENASKIVNGHHWRHIAGERKADRSSFPGYIDTAAAGKLLGVTTARVAQLAKEGTLESVRCRQGLLVSERSVRDACHRPRRWKRRQTAG